MPSLHIVQGGVENGDKAWLDKASVSEKLSGPAWVVPKRSHVDDDVVIYVGGYGFYATAQIRTEPTVRADWPNRYGALIGSIKKINPPISLAFILEKIPELTWAKYPRSITSPFPGVADQIRQLIEQRRSEGVTAISGELLSTANLAELRAMTLPKIPAARKVLTREAIVRLRSNAIREYALKRSVGRCEGCSEPAPFRTASGTPYLEVHHMLQVADDGPDEPENVIALCPNCHRRAHLANDAEKFNKGLRRTVRKKEASLQTR